MLELHDEEIMPSIKVEMRDQNLKTLGTAERKEHASVLGKLRGVLALVAPKIFLIPESIVDAIDMEHEFVAV